MPFDIIASNFWDCEIDRLISKLIMKEISSRTFKKQIKQAVTATLKDDIKAITEKDFTTLYHAWYDVARYQTDIFDAANTWAVDCSTLNYLIFNYPIPTTIEERLKLSTPPEVKKIREI